MPEALAPPKPEPEAELDALVPRPALIGRGDPFPPRTQVVAVQFGTFLSLHSERLQIKKEGKVVDEIPLFRMSELVVGAKGVALSCDLIRELCERGIRTVFLESTGMPYAMLSSPMLTATVRTRREQMAAFEDERGVRIARALVAGKLHNQANLLKYFAKYLAQADPVRFDRVRDAASTIEALLPRLGRPGGPGVVFSGGETEWDARPAGPVGLRPSSAPRARSGSRATPTRSRGSRSSCCRSRCSSSRCSRCRGSGAPRSRSRASRRKSNGKSGSRARWRRASSSHSARHTCSRCRA